MYYFQGSICHSVRPEKQHICGRCLWEGQVQWMDLCNHRHLSPGWVQRQETSMYLRSQPHRPLLHLHWYLSCAFLIIHSHYFSPIQSGNSMPSWPKSSCTYVLRILSKKLLQSSAHLVAKLSFRFGPAVRWLREWDNSSDEHRSCRPCYGGGQTSLLGRWHRSGTDTRTHGRWNSFWNCYFDDSNCCKVSIPAS